MIALAALLLASYLSAPSAQWHDSLQWRGQTATITAEAGGRYRLDGPFGERPIAAQPASAHTASPLFDGLFAMAQDDLNEDAVATIHDDTYDHGRSIPCRCFVAGAKWPYVWTRDVSYSIDLGLFRYDPDRARASLLFKLSPVRARNVPPGLYPMQDTGSGGSWPVSTDRVVWFLAARHLLDDKPFAAKVWRALTDTLAQDRTYTFDTHFGLYRGETSFLDWREQTYPGWTHDNVVFIAQSYALSTNVLHYEALRLAARMAATHDPSRATYYRDQAMALKTAINRHFWNPARGMYMSYIGSDGLPVDAYDLLGLALAVTSGVADPDRARATLAYYPVWPAGSPVIWPERVNQPIYHNRAIWPFVTAYALRAARKLNDPNLIAFEIRSLMRGAALAGSNMENYALVSETTHVDAGRLSGPVVDSPRQLWSVAGYLDMVTEGVFGLGSDDRITPKIPATLIPMLFGTRERITLRLTHRTITLVRPQRLTGNLLIAGATSRSGTDTIVHLKAVEVASAKLRTGAPMYAPPTPRAPSVADDGDTWRVTSAGGRGRLYVDGQRFGSIGNTWVVARTASRRCFRVTRVGTDDVESLPSPATCEGRVTSVTGTWPREWMAPASGHYRAVLLYRNTNGPINTGITAAVKRLVTTCGSAPSQAGTIVMPQGLGEQVSTAVTFDAEAGASCVFALDQGFNMSDLAHFSSYTGGKGGSSGPLNAAQVGVMRISQINADASW